MPRVVRTTRLMLVALARRVPMTRLSSLLGLSDVGLAKVYAHDWIGHATRGHWSRREHGRDVPRIRLRGPRSTWRQCVSFGSGARDRTNGRRDDDLIDLLERDADAPSTTLLRDLRNAHALVHRGASAAARRPHLGEESLPGVAADAMIDVPRSQRVRARKVVDALLRALEIRRIRVRIDLRRAHPVPEIEILGVRVGVTISFQRAAPGGDAVLEARVGGRGRDRELVLHARVPGARSGPCWGGPGRRRVESRIDEVVADLIALAVETRENSPVLDGAGAPETRSPRPT